MPDPLVPLVKWATVLDMNQVGDAKRFLRMTSSGKMADQLVNQMVTGQPRNFKAKDILRASGLQLLPPTDPHVAESLQKIANGVALQPVYAVKGDITTGRPLVVADGYHRTCAVFHTDPSTDIPTMVASL